MLAIPRTVVLLIFFEQPYYGDGERSETSKCVGSFKISYIYPLSEPSEVAGTLPIESSTIRNPKNVGSETHLMSELSSEHPHYHAEYAWQYVQGFHY